MTANNILLTPGNWSDIDLRNAYSPVAQTEWDGTNGYFHFVKSDPGGNLQASIRFTGTIQPGDRLGLRILTNDANVSAQVALDSSIDSSGYLQVGTLNWTPSMTPGVATDDALSRALTSSDAPVITIVADAAATSMDVKVIPVVIPAAPTATPAITGEGLTLVRFDPQLDTPFSQTGFFGQLDGMVLANGETIDHLEFNYGEDATWDRGCNDQPTGLDGYPAVYFGSHTYAAAGTYTVTMRVYTVEAGATPYELTSSFTAVAGAVQLAGYSHTSNALALTLTDNNQSVEVDPATAGNPPAGQLKFADRYWEIYDAQGKLVTTLTSAADAATQYAAPSTTWTAPANGSYRIKLYVDGTGSTGEPVTAMYEQVITLPEAAPAATVPDFTDTINYLAVTFADATTFDPTVTATAYAWNFGDGATSAVQNPSHTYANGGSYTVQLSVTDSTGATTSVTHTVVVKAQTQPAFTTSVSDLTVSFTDATAFDPAVAATAYAWDFGDGTSSTEKDPVHVYAAAGDYAVKLTVTDNSGTAATSTTQSVHVAQPNPNPVANFSYAVAGMTVTFTDSSTDAFGTITGRLWDFGDGQNSTAVSPSHTYAVAGTYPVVLTLTDQSGLTSTKTAAIAVGDAADGSDTYVLKGFIDYSALADNNPAVISPIGELSAKSETYATDRKLFGGSTGGTTPSAMNLTVFASFDKAEAPRDVPGDYANMILGITAWMYNQAINGAFGADSSVFQQAFLAQYNSVVQDVKVGTMMAKGSTWLPSSLEFYFINPSAVWPSITTKSRIKLWFADTAFQTEYDEYAVVFIPPVISLDVFFKSTAEVQTALSQLTWPDLTVKVETAKANAPYTYLQAHNYNWYNPNDATQSLPTVWTYILYGAAGNNIDVIKQALAQYILNNSTHGRDEWAKVFPDIFSSTEFILTPMWTQVAIPNQTYDTGVYSPTVNYGQALNIAQATAKGTGYTNEFIANKLDLFPVPFKSMQLLAVGGPNNVGGINEFAKRWTDYINVSSTHADFDRMQQSTQTFVLMLNNMLRVAESMTSSSDLPVGMTRLTRQDTQGNKVDYLVSSLNGVDYLMVTKAWMVAKYGQSTNTVGSIGISYDGIYVNGAFQLLNSSAQMTLQFAAENARSPLKFEILDTDISSATIEETTGKFVGTFPTEGAYSLTLKLTDSNAFSVQRTFAFNYAHPSNNGGSGVAQLALININAPNAMTGQAYSGSVEITGGTSPYSLNGAQTLPAGLAASVQGNLVVLGGTPTVGGAGVFNISVKDSSGAGGGAAMTANTQFTISINTPMTFGAPDNTTVTTGQPFTSNMAIDGGTAPYTVDSTSGLPSGFSTNISGSTLTVSGTTSDTSINTATVTVKDATGQTAVASFPLGRAF